MDHGDKFRNFARVQIYFPAGNFTNNLMSTISNDVIIL